MMMRLNSKLLDLIDEGLSKVYDARIEERAEARQRFSVSQPCSPEEARSKAEVQQAEDEVEYLHQVAECFRDFGKEVIGGKIEGYFCEGLFSLGFDWKDLGRRRVRLEIRCVDEATVSEPEAPLV